MLRQQEGSEPSVKILDFGLAKIRSEALAATQWDAGRSQAPTRHAAAFGTPAYMAPEQAVGGEMDGRTDLYSLGVVLYELLAGEPPFPGDTPAQILKQHLTGSVAPLRERVPSLQLPAELEALIMKLLEKVPDQRPADAREALSSIGRTGSEERPETNSLALALADLRPPSLAPATPFAASTSASSLPDPGLPAAPPAANSGDGQKEPLPPLQTPSVVGLAAPTPAPTVPSHRPGLWVQGLDWIRPRLPPQLQGSASTVLGVMIFAMVTLPMLVILAVAWPGGDSAKRSNSKSEALTGYASEREMERGVAQGARALAALVAKYPSDARCHRALVRAHAAAKDYTSALRALIPLLQLDPSAQSDEAMGQVVAEAAMVPELSDSALAFLETALGEHGIDVLLELADKTSAEPMRTKFNQSLTKDGVRRLASPETLLLLDLRAAARCEQKRALLPRAAQQGGARVRLYLQGLQSPVGCGRGGQADCWPCLRRGGALQNAIIAIDQRGGVSG
jgi:serine/threonine-protein kinase